MTLAYSRFSKIPPSAERTSPLGCEQRALLLAFSADWSWCGLTHPKCDQAIHPKFKLSQYRQFSHPYNVKKKTTRLKSGNLAGKLWEPARLDPSSREMITTEMSNFTWKMRWSSNFTWIIRRSSIVLHANRTSFIQRHMSKCGALPPAGILGTPIL